MGRNRRAGVLCLVLLLIDMIVASFLQGRPYTLGRIAGYAVCGIIAIVLLVLSTVYLRRR